MQPPTNTPRVLLLPRKSLESDVAMLHIPEKEQGPTGRRALQPVETVSLCYCKIHSMSAYSPFAAIIISWLLQMGNVQDWTKVSGGGYF